MSLLLGFIFSHDSKDTVGHGIIHGMAFGLGVNHEMTFGLEVTTRVFGLIIQAVLTICCFHCVFCVFGTQSQQFLSALFWIQNGVGIMYGSMRMAIITLASWVAFDSRI